MSQLLLKCEYYTSFGCIFTARIFTNNFDVYFAILYTTMLIFRPYYLQTGRICTKSRRNGVMIQPTLVYSNPDLNWFSPYNEKS